MKHMSSKPTAPHTTITLIGVLQPLQTVFALTRNDPPAAPGGGGGGPATTATAPGGGPLA